MNTFYKAIFSIILLTPVSVSASSIDFSNMLVSSSYSIYEKPLNSSLILLDKYGVASNSDPQAISKELNVASVQSYSSVLSLDVSATVYGTNIDGNSAKYVNSESIAWFESDFVISGVQGNAYLNISTTSIFDEISTNDSNTYVHGEQSIRIFDKFGMLLFGYLEGVSDKTELENIILDFNSVYRFEMISTAYARANAGYDVLNARTFDAELSASPVPIPASFFLLMSGIPFLLFSKFSSRKSRT